MSPAMRLCRVSVFALLAGCAAPPPAPTVPAFDVEAAVAAIHAASSADEGELVVRPLGDNQTRDLREQADLQLQQRDYAAAAQTLDQALAIDPQDPELLQQRAEVALLQRDFAAATQFVQQAIARGTEVGPLCRRHWETVAQLRQATPADAAGDTVAEARRRRDACTVAQPPRY